MIVTHNKREKAEDGGEAPPYLAIVGPTASGKSSLALDIARHCAGEIVNCDSVQLYRGFDIGAAKPSSLERQQVVHHLLDIAAWDKPLDASLFAQQAQQKIREIAARGRLAIVVGGSGLYLRALWGEQFHELPADPAIRARLQAQEEVELYRLLQEKDPQRAREIHPRDKFRIVRALEIIMISGTSVKALTASSTAGHRSFAPSCIVLLDPPRAQLHAAIALRTRAMLKAGLLDEVKALLTGGCPPEAKVMQSIGYKQVLDFLAGKLSAELLEEKMIAATRQYAKRQVTWFRKTRGDIVLQQAAALPTLLEQVKAFFPASHLALLKNRSKASASRQLSKDK